MKIKVFFEMYAYNTEQYIREAFDSLINQTDPSWVLFVIDNGSTDRTGEICDEYAKKDNRIKCVHCAQNHKPTKEEVSLIRNLRKEYFNTEKCEFYANLDSDDYYHPRFIEKAYAAAKEHNADLVVCGCAMFNDEDHNKTGDRIPPSAVIENKVMSEDQFEGLYNPLRTLWGKLYSIEIRMRRDEVAPYTGEIANGYDTFQVLNFLNKCANRIVTVPEVLYYYRIRKTSLYRSSLDIKRFNEGKILYDLGIETAINYNVLTDRIKYFLQRIYLAHINGLWELVALSAEITAEEKIAFISYPLQDEVFTSISNLLPEVAFPMLKETINSVLKDLSIIEQAKLTRFYAVKMCVSPYKEACPNLNKAWEFAALCDVNNKLYWGNDLLSDVKSYDKQVIIFSLNSSVDNNHINAKNNLLSAIDERDYELATKELDYLLSVTPLDQQVLYLGMYFYLVIKDYVNALLLSEIAKVFFPDDEDVCEMIRNVYNQIEVN